METHITTKANLLKRYIEEMKFIKQSILKIQSENKEFFLPISYYEECALIYIEGIITLMKIPRNSSIYRHPDTIRVDNNPRYTLPNILSGYVVNGNIVLEGADGVGKTTISKILAEKGIITEDRNVPNISWLMEPEYDRTERIKTIGNYITSNPNKTIIFLFNSNEKELMDRINNRAHQSDYDKYALYKQDKYLDTYRELQHLKNLVLYDVNGKSIAEVANTVSTYTSSYPKSWVKK